MAKKGTTRAASEKQEKRLHKMFEEFGAWNPANSGATPFKKGDVLTQDFYMDGKSSMELKRQKSVNLEEIELARQNANYMRKQFSAIVLCFGDEKDYFVMEASELLELYRGYRAAERLRESELLEEVIGDDCEEIAFKKELRRILGGAC